MSWTGNLSQLEGIFIGCWVGKSAQPKALRAFFQLRRMSKKVASFRFNQKKSSRNSQQLNLQNGVIQTVAIPLKPWRIDAQCTRVLTFSRRAPSAIALVRMLFFHALVRHVEQLGLATGNGKFECCSSFDESTAVLHEPETASSAGCCSNVSC